MAGLGSFSAGHRWPGRPRGGPVGDVLTSPALPISHLGGAPTHTALQVWVARGILLLAVVIVGWLLAGLLSYLVQRSGLSLGLDRMLGSVFGLVRGAVIAGFAVMLGQAAKLDSESWWKRSTLMPAGIEMAGILRSYVETGRQMVDTAVEET